MYTVVEERERLLDRYDRFLVRYGIPAVIGIFAVIIVWFAVRGQETNAWMTFVLFVFAMFLLISPIGISAARSPPWEK